jgi:dihydroflavonol-4-reductase
MGERHIRGGENLTFRQITAIISNIVGRRAPARTLPPAAAALDLANRFIPCPKASGDQLRFSAQNIFFDSSKAVAELGYRILSFRAAAERAYHWRRAHGYIS